MAGRTPKLTPEVQDLIVAYIRAGSYEHVAAEAAGVGRSTFYRWMDRGRKARSGIYHDFAVAVREARAQARASAEIEVRKTDPFKWLRFGPGRERPGDPGWTESTQLTGADGGPLVVSFDMRGTGDHEPRDEAHDDD